MGCCFFFLLNRNFFSGFAHSILSFSDLFPRIDKTCFGLIIRDLELVILSSS